MRFEFSAGGVVFKKEGKEVLILVARHSGHHGWVFPKGHINPSASSGRSETKEEAALREVQEETGVTAFLRKALTPVRYWFVHDKEKIKKTVYYFVMEYRSQDTTIRDQEMEEVLWISMHEVAERLTYPSDKKVWQEAKKSL